VGFLFFLVLDSYQQTLDAPNGAAVIYLWRRYFEEEEAQRDGEEGHHAANSVEDGADAPTQDPIASPKNRELRQELRRQYYLGVTGRLPNNFSSTWALAMTSEQSQTRIAREEERVLHPNIQVPAGHDPAIYLAQ
jgi:hypothetical protein